MPIRVDRSSPVPLYFQVAQHLEHMIESGELPMGTRLENETELADQIGLDAFVIVVVGGFGSLLGALVASLLLGELNSFGVQFIPRLAPVLMFAFMAVVLAFKPTGFFGERE